jgi:CHAT domain-containing protein
MRQLVEDRTNHDYRKPAAQLYTWLIDPLDAFLDEGDGSRTLVFVPSGPFAGIPFAALYDAVEQKFLIEQHAIAISPGLSLIEPRALDVNSEKHMALQAALTTAVADYPALASAATEVDEIRQLLGGKTLVDQGFVMSALDHELATVPYEIVHIASHGQFGEDADSTYLLTYDGRIGLSALADLVAQTRFREKPLELLTLSACQTAAGDERAALGLAGVAVRAGARSTVASLWSVNDESTARLMRTFYEHIVQGGTSRARALQLAQQEVLSDAVFRHPAHWSAFVLVGSWR